MIDCIVASAGGIEEDFIKCLAPTYIGDFSLPGRELRDKGINRIGNLLVPNNNYVKFEEWLMPILDKLLEEQNKNGVVWTPSKIIHRLGELSFRNFCGYKISDFCDRLGLEINNESSIYYWAAK